LTAAVRPYDSVGRYGGEEFLIVAPGCSLKETWELAERVRNSVANRTTSDQVHKLSVTLSLGFASGGAESDLEGLLHAADNAMYQAKRAGRNRVEPQDGAWQRNAAVSRVLPADLPEKDYLP
jgi:two-component system, cell cycle response regulator